MKIFGCFLRKRIRICITLEEAEDNPTIRDLMEYRPIERFNPLQTHLIWIYFDFHYGCIDVFLYHPEFETVPPGAECKVYTMEGAAKRYPFLFNETNPILYRRF